MEHWPPPVWHQNRKIVYAMLGHHRSARRQSPRLSMLLVLATVSTFVVTLSEAQNYGPEIITYGDCPNRGGQQLPYRIQTPVPPASPKSSVSCEPKPVERQSYGYNIDGLADSRYPPADHGGAHLPVSIQRPVLTESGVGPAQYIDPLRGKSYGIGIQPTYNGPHNSPSLGQYNFGVQKSVPSPKRPDSAGPSSPYNDPFRVQIQPGANPNQGPALWGPLPIAGIERPAQSRSDPGQVGPAGPAPRLRGLTSMIDKLLLPANCPLPMDGQGGGPGGNGPLGGAGYPGANGPLGGAGYPGGNGPLGGGGYPGGNSPMGGGGYPGGNGPMGGGGSQGGSSRSGGAVYPGGSGPLGGGGFSGGNGSQGSGGFAGGNGPVGGAGYSRGNGPFGGAGYPGGQGHFGRGGSCSCA